MSLFVCSGEPVRSLFYDIYIYIYIYIYKLLFVGVSLLTVFFAYYYMLHFLVCMFVSHRQQ